MLCMYKFIHSSLVIMLLEWWWILSLERWALGERNIQDGTPVTLRTPGAHIHIHKGQFIVGNPATLNRGPWSCEVAMQYAILYIESS